MYIFSYKISKIKSKSKGNMHLHFVDRILPKILSPVKYFLLAIKLLRMVDNDNGWEV